MGNLFCVGFGGLPKLRGVTLASNRGYWEKQLLFEQMLEAGADVIGTVKQVCIFFFAYFFVVVFSSLTYFADCCVIKSNWFPLTYAHADNAPFPQAPQDIPKEGYRDCFHLQTKWKGAKAERLLNVLVYTSRTGTAVALSFSS